MGVELNMKLMNSLVFTGLEYKHIPAINCDILVFIVLRNFSNISSFLSSDLATSLSD